MNDYLKKAIETKHDRRPVFETVLSVCNKPTDILVIGAERASTPESIYGDGFFSLYAAQHVQEHGGSLTIVDIDPTAFQRCTEIMSDFLSTISMQIVCGDGIQWIENKDWDLIYLDGDDNPDSMYEQFKKCDLTKSHVLCDDFHGKGTRLRKDFQDFALFRCNYLHQMGFYHKIVGNEDYFNIGEIRIPYVREKPNRSWYNERAMELGVAKYFVETVGELVKPETIEVGDVCPHYSFFTDWKVVDPYGPYKKAIKKDVMDYDYRGQNVLCISTLEHMSSKEYSNTDDKLAIKALEKITKESNFFLITIPIGANRVLEEDIRKNYMNFTTIMRRTNKRGSTNNWVEDRNVDYFEEDYGHFSFGLSYYGNATHVLVLSNLKEIV